MALNQLLPRLPSLSVLAAADNVCRIDLTVLFPDCASIEIGVPPEQPHSVDVQPSTIYVTVTPPTVTAYPPRGEHPHGPGAGGPDGHPHWPVTATTTCDEEGLVTAMPIPTGRPPFGPGGPGSGGPGSGGSGSGNNGPGNGNNGPGNGSPGAGGPGNNGPGNGGPGNGNNGPGNGGPGNGNNGPGNGGPGNGNNGPNDPNGPGNNNGGRPSTTLATVTRPSLPTSTSTSCPLPPFLSISTTLTDLLDLDLKLYLDLASLTSGVSSLFDSVIPGLGNTVSNLLGANNLPASPSNLPTTQRSRFRTLPCGTSLGSLPGASTGTVPIDGPAGNGPDGSDGNGNGPDGNNSNGNNGENSGTSAIEECIKRCEKDAIRASLELMTLRDCLGVTVDRRTTIDNCLWFVGPRGEKLPVLDLGVVVDLTGPIGEGEGVESAVRDVEEVTGDATDAAAQ